MRGKSKLVIKHHVNIHQKLEHLLTAIADEQQLLKEHKKLEQQFGSRLKELESTLLKLAPQKNNLAILLQVTTLQIDEQLRQKRQTYGFILHIVIGIKALVFMSAYFRLIPQSSFARHPSIYVVAAILLVMVWIGYLYLFEKSYTLFLQSTVRPFAAKHATGD